MNRWRGVSLVAFALAWACIATAGQAASQPAAQRTVWDGVYTEAQAGRGRAVYAQSCAGCHADDLRGRSTAPSLVEESFAFLWGDMPLGELFEKTRTRMPSDRPNSLPGEAYADLLAFIMQKNGFPPGPEELPADVTVLGRILIATARPSK